MKIRIAENIKNLRKAHSLTQEQMAEALGVTVGAVYKWEAGLSMPEIKLIMEIADFFEISVDILLGYVKVVFVAIFIHTDKTGNNLHKAS